MAATHCTAAAAVGGGSRLHLTTTKFSKMPLRLTCSSYIPTSRRHTKRKNHLRQKLLKTLIKPPYPETLTPEPPPSDHGATLLPSPEKDSRFASSDQPSGEPPPDVAVEEVKELEREEFEQSEASEYVESSSGNVGNFPQDLDMKVGLWLLGAFMFQTICAVWVFGSADFGKKLRTFESRDANIDKGDVLESGVKGNGDSRLKLDVNGKVGFDSKGSLHVNEDEMVKKIEEIKVLAREAREKERVERKENGSDGNESDHEDEEEDSFGKSDIEKEVFERLQKLRMRSLKNRVGYLKGNGERKDGVGKQGNEELLFKKKYKFKGSLREERDRPKGFSGVSNDGDDGTIGRSFNNGDEALSSENEVDGGVDVLDDKHGSPWELHEGGELNRSAEMDFEGTGRRKAKFLKTVEKQDGKRVGVAKSKPPKVQDKNYRRLSVETGNSRETSMAVSDIRDQSLKSRGVGQKQSASSKKLDCESDWWSGLPYVLVILMQRGRDGEGQRGLYTLKGSSYTDGELSQVVAFVDRGDATNFCYLLQSFFEELGDFSTEIVPLSIKDLRKETKSETKKVIVVKKGQLQLYAGQPLDDVEMALRSLVE